MSNIKSERQRLTVTERKRESPSPGGIVVNKSRRPKPLFVKVNSREQVLRNLFFVAINITAIVGIIKLVNVIVRDAHRDPPEVRSERQKQEFIERIERLKGTLPEDSN